MRDVGGFAVFIHLEQIEFTFRADTHLISGRGGFCHRVFEDTPAIPCERTAVRMPDVTVKPHNPPLRGPPWQHCQCARIREEEQIAFLHVHEPFDCRSVETDSLLECALQFVRHDRNIFKRAKDIAEGQTHKLYIIFFNKPQHFVHCIIHNQTPSKPYAAFFL